MRQAQHREGYYTSVRTHSTRTRNTDGSRKEGGPINREGRLSHHLADGATYILRRGDEYNAILPVWNWKLIPGTTAEQVPALDQTRVVFMGTTSFVGGVSDGLYGAATMDLQRQKLRAKKSWFYFDDEFVALGAGITNISDNPVVTTVNQLLLRGEVRVSNQVAPLPVEQHDETETRWVLHDEIGYLFPSGSPVHLDNQTRTGRWSDSGSGPDSLVSKDVFSLFLDHGTRPEDANYEYIVIPNTNVHNLNQRLAHPLSNRLPTHPICKRLGTMAWRYYKPFSIERVVWMAGPVGASKWMCPAC